MNIFCYLFGHDLRQELQKTDNNPINNDEHWLTHTRVNTIYLCKRCCYTFTNTINFGNKIEKDKSETN